MAIYLIRHGHAGSRTDWQDDDGSRPLSKRGRDQARHLDQLLANEPIQQVFSSPARRCIETVEPLAARRGVNIEVVPEMDEGAEAEDAIAFLLRQASYNTVLCSHGDVIPKMIRRLNVRSKDPNVSQKGSLWILDLAGDGITSGRYEPPKPH